MTQTATSRFQWRTAPGHIYTPAQERETESCFSPFVLQELTVTIAGANPFAADATATITFPLQDGSGLSGVVGPVAIPTGTTLTQAAALLAAAWAASPQGGQLYDATSALAVVTLVSRSGNTSIAPGLITVAFSDAHTGTVAQSVAAAAPSIQMGLWYVYDDEAPQVVGGITGTPRGCYRVRTPLANSTLADLRGLVGWVPGQATLPNLGTTQDGVFYDAGQIWPGLLRGEGAFRVDPASASMDVGSEIHVVIAAGAYSIIGSVAAAADGVNTIRVDNAPVGQVRARVTMVEENLTPFRGSAGRYVALKINQTN